MKISITEKMKFRQKIVGYAMDYSLENGCIHLAHTLCQF